MITKLMPVHDTDTETRAHYLWRVAMAYDVPLDLIRYDVITYDATQRDTYGCTSKEVD